MTRLIVAGTDTNIGKTVLAAAIAAATGAAYWKPIQSGTAQGLDADVASGLGVRTIYPEAFRLTEPLSPHRAAELDGITIESAALKLPEGPLVVEGAGGVHVPVRRDLLFADLFVSWQLPVVLAARTTLGTINHSLLSIEALRTRRVPILGIAFIGDPNSDNEATIAALGGVRRLGRLPWLDPLDAETLARAFATNFRIEDFIA